MSSRTIELSELQGVGSGWPAVEEQDLGPWVARASEGFTRWANSVLVRGDVPAQDLPALIEQAEAFYDARRLPCQFRLSVPVVADPADEPLALALLERGYRRASGADTQIWVAELRELRAAAPPKRFGRVRIEGDPQDAWLQCWTRWLGVAVADRSAALELLSMLERRVGFACHVNGVDLLATGIGVVEGAWLAMHDLLSAPALPVLPPGSSTSAGSLLRVVSALATWGIAHAARHGYLYVGGPQSAAAQLWGAIGFRPAAQVGFFERPVTTA